MADNIILVGFMGTGKTAVSKQLAKKLDWQQIDIDDLIEETANKKISDIFAENGEQYFRDLETEALRRIISLKNHIVSTGGGAVLREENMKIMKQAGVVICLSAEPEIIYDRVKTASHRPLLQTEDPLQKIKDLLEFRAPFYEKADYMIDTSYLSVDQVVKKILKYIK